ncbi:MAG: lysophospholipid acyltransferase family protein [bacterium]
MIPYWTPSRRSVIQNLNGKEPRSVDFILVQIAVRCIFRIYFRHRSFGTRHVPDDSGAVIATNHASNLDPLLVNVDIPRPLFYMAKKSLHEIPLFGPLIRHFYAFPVRRGGADRKAIRHAVDIIKAGNLLLMFPEGTRTRNGELQRPRRGIGKIVDDSGCPVVPGYLDGSFRAMKPGDWFPKPVHTSIRFGEPLNFAEDGEGQFDSRREGEQYIADEVMKAIKDIKLQNET